MAEFNVSSPSAHPSEFFGLGRGVEARARLQILSAIVAKLPTAIDPLVDVKIVNRFQAGMYFRECHIPKGTFGVSRIHCTDHVSIMSKGKCIVADSDGERVVTAPASFKSIAGAQRAVIALEDTVWTTIHNSTGLTEDSTEEEIRAIISADDYSDSRLPALIEGN
jgi:hypothetical protein